MLSLNATFENSIGRRHSFNLKDPDRNKPAEEIRGCLQKLVDLNLFEKGEVGLFKKLISAKFVETIETPIFDLRKDGDGMEAAPATDVQPSFIETIDVQPESVQMEEAPTIDVQPESAQMQEAPAAVNIPQLGMIASQSASVLEQAAPSQPASAQTMDKSRSQGGTQCIRITVPHDYQPNQMSDEELVALLSTGLPEGAKLEDFSLDDIVMTLEEPGEVTTPLAPIAPVTEQMTSTPVDQAIEMRDEFEEESAEEKRTGWFPKRKKGTNPLAGFSADRRKNKKAINRWKREKNKDKKK